MKTPDRPDVPLLVLRVMAVATAINQSIQMLTECAAAAVRRYFPHRHGRGGRVQNGPWARQRGVDVVGTTRCRENPVTYRRESQTPAWGNDFRSSLSTNDGFRRCSTNGRCPMSTARCCRQRDWQRTCRWPAPLSGTPQPRPAVYRSRFQSLQWIHPGGALDGLIVLWHWTAQDAGTVCVRRCSANVRAARRSLMSGRPFLIPPTSLNGR